MYRSHSKSSPSRSLTRTISHTNHQKPSIQARGNLSLLSKPVFTSSRQISQQTLSTYSSKLSHPTNSLKSQLTSTHRLLSTSASTASTTESTVSETPLKKQGVLTIERICNGIGLEGLLPTFEKPPYLESLEHYPHRQTKQKPLSTSPNANDDNTSATSLQSSPKPITLYDLTLISTEDYRVLIPNDVNRNRLKEHLRMLISTGLVADGHPALTQQEFSAVLESIMASEKQSTDPKTTTQTTPSGETASTTQSDSTTPSPDAVVDDEGKPRSQKSVADEIKSSSIQALEMPQFFDAMREGTITEWHVKVGEHFLRGQTICDIETDIAEISFEASEPGHLSEILVAPGQPVKVGEAIAVMRYVEEKY